LNSGDGQHQLLPEELHEHVETFSLVFERFGFQRMAGRIFALMLLRNESLVTQAQLAEELGASTGSISTMIRLLEQLGFVERVSLPGHRRDRFRLTEDPLVEMTVRRLEGAGQMVKIINAARATHNIGPNADARLERAMSFYVFFMEEMARSLEEWRRSVDDTSNA
jgi:DNA-binding transcriptional regulator GbsR (MarR family)